MIHVLLKQLLSSFDANRFALCILKCVPRTQPTVIRWHHCRRFVWFHAASAQNKTSFYATFFFLLQTGNFFSKAYNMTREKKHFDVWNRWISPYRLTPVELSWPSSFCVRQFWWRFILGPRFNFTASSISMTQHCNSWTKPPSQRSMLHSLYKTLLWSGGGWRAANM